MSVPRASARLLCTALLVFTLVVLATSAPLAAQTATATLSANLGTIAKLSFSSTTLSFPDADPDAVAQVPASGGPVTITAKARASAGPGRRDRPRQRESPLRRQHASSRRVHLDGDRRRLRRRHGQRDRPRRWSAPGPAPASTSGSQTFLFRNSWIYPVGVYSMTLIYTLTDAMKRRLFSAYRAGLCWPARCSCRHRPRPSGSTSPYRR